MLARHPVSNALFTDLYELTMAQAYWQNGMHAPATFSLFFRKYPADRGYFVFAGLQDVLDYLEHFHFTVEDLAYLSSLRRFAPPFLDFLANLRFSGRVRALREGEIFFINEPVLEVTAPLLEAQLLETFLVNQVNLQTLLASKAARVVAAAQGKAIIDFSARRCQGLDAANKLARAAFLVGFAGTSNVQAAALYDLPAFGTMAHSFVTACPSELEAFRLYARSFPDSTTLLVDTYDTLDGVRKAITVARELRSLGLQVRAVRLDSGDLLALARGARSILDEAGFPEIHIVASGGLDEYEVDRLVLSGAPIDTFAVGTKVGVSADAPWTDCAYKLVEYAGRPLLKLSAGKQTLPGGKQVFRLSSAHGRFCQDIIARADEQPPKGAEALMHDVMAGGQPLAAPTPLQELRGGFQQRFTRLGDEYKALRHPPEYPVALSEGLQELQQSVTRALQRRELGCVFT